MRINFSIFIYILCPLLLTQCDGENFPDLPPISRIELRNNLDQRLKVYEDKEKIGNILIFIHSKKKGWYIPFAGAPIPKKILELHSENRFIGFFGAGSDFFSAHFNGDFYTRKANPAELDEFLRLIED